MLRLAFFASLLATTASADPSYHRVTGVASDDTLNVRAAPDGSSEDIGDLPHDTTAIEVIDTDESGTWGRILWQEANGWIAMRFLEPDPIATLGDTTLPVGLLCSGAEPFWSIRLAETTAVYSDPTYSAVSLALDSALVAAGRPAFPAALHHSNEGGSTTSILRPQLCSDGMSDREYPYAIATLLRIGEQETLFEGCCRLPLEAGMH